MAAVTALSEPPMPVERATTLAVPLVRTSGNATFVAPRGMYAFLDGKGMTPLAALALRALQRERCTGTHRFFLFFEGRFARGNVTAAVIALMCRSTKRNINADPRSISVFFSSPRASGWT